MTHRKTTPLIHQQNTRICPVCGKRAYSAGGIHPQCAVLQADAPREQQLKAQRKIDAARKSAERKVSQTWSQKKCPKCGVEVHVRKRMCDCGYDFAKP